jgi:acetyl-CoA carboxylase biotin carboxylase subunit
LVTSNAKATAGGGGKGMRAVWKDEDLLKSMGWSSSRICRCFWNDGMYLEN